MTMLVNHVKNINKNNLDHPVISVHPSCSSSSQNKTSPVTFDPVTGKLIIDSSASSNNTATTTSILTTSSYATIAKISQPAPPVSAEVQCLQQENNALSKKLPCWKSRLNYYHNSHFNQLRTTFDFK